MVKGKISWNVYIMAAALTFIIFFGGLGVGLLFSNEKYQIIRQEFEEFQIQQRDIEFELLLLSSMGTEFCGTLEYEIGKTSYLASDLGEKVSRYGSDVVRDPDFILLKKNYMITLAQFWSYWEIFKKNCNSSVNTVLYLYSLEDCSDCQVQGYILSVLKENYPNDIMIFSLDKDVELYSINLLNNIYNVTTTPTLIINNEKYEGLKDINQLEEILIL
ncbi:MAG: hypothetical protein ABIE55_00065 [Candidatus Aenigmatarchaeota archaeon]